MLAAVATAGAEPQPAKPIDFHSIERRISKTPELNAPLYGLFLFGEKKVWVVLDKSKGADHYDRLYIDRNADGDLTQDGELITAPTTSKRSTGVWTTFTIGDFKDPASGATHTKFELTHTDASVFFSMQWRGEQVTMGAYGPTRDTYAQLGKTVESAPIFVPGYDRPLEFEHWMSGTLQRKGYNDFKVFLGRRGSKRGAFCSSDDKFLPPGEYVLATLIYTDANGKEKRYQAKLKERC